jgi:hypothetical protein
MRTLLTIALLFIAIYNFACSCEHVGILRNKKTAYYVFKGRVTDIKESTRQDTITGTTQLIEYTETQYKFDIIKNYKGLAGTHTINLLQGMTECEVTFQMGKVYIVYAYIENRKLHYKIADQRTEPYPTTHLCMRTKKTSVLSLWETLVLWLS